MLEGGPEHRVIDHHQGFRFQRRGAIGGALDVGHDPGGIRGRLDQHDAQIFCVANSCVDLRGLPGFDRNASHSPARQKVFDQLLCAAVYRHRIHDGVARFEEREQRRHDGRHPGVERQRALGAGFERQNLRFQNFGVGMIEARVDQVDLLVFFRRAAAPRHQIERRAPPLLDSKKRRSSFGKQQAGPSRRIRWGRSPA